MGLQRKARICNATFPSALAIKPLSFVVACRLYVMRVYVRACVCDECVRAGRRACVCVCIYIFVYLCVCVYIYIYLCVYIYLCIYLWFSLVARLLRLGHCMPASRCLHKEPTHQRAHTTQLSTLARVPLFPRAMAVALTRFAPFSRISNLRTATSEHENPTMQHQNIRTQQCNSKGGGCRLRS